MTEKCKSCYWFSDVTVNSCERDGEPCDPNAEACSRFESGEEDCDQIEYEMAVEMQEYCEMYEPTYNPEDGSM